MNLDETLAIIQAANVVDPRVEVSKETVRMWHKMIGDLAASDAADALERHYRATDERVMPAHVRKLVNGGPDAGRHAHREIEADRGVGKPADYQQQVTYWTDRARESGRYCHCPHHGDGWASEPYWERNR